MVMLFRLIHEFLQIERVEESRQVLSKPMGRILNDASRCSSRFSDAHHLESCPLTNDAQKQAVRNFHLPGNASYTSFVVAMEALPELPCYCIVFVLCLLSVERSIASEVQVVDVSLSSLKEVRIIQHSLHICCYSSSRIAQVQMKAVLAGWRLIL